ncbi:unnamed protein product [Camellia sinensis]
MMSHDYVLRRSDRGVLYMSELDIGMTFPDYFTALVRSKVGSAAARRDVLLKAAKVQRESWVWSSLSGPVPRFPAKTFNSDRHHEEVSLGNLRRFQFRELQAATDNFSSKNILGKMVHGSKKCGSGVKVCVEVRRAAKARLPPAGEAE